MVDLQVQLDGGLIAFDPLITERIESALQYLLDELVGTAVVSAEF